MTGGGGKEGVWLLATTGGTAGDGGDCGGRADCGKGLRYVGLFMVSIPLKEGGLLILIAGWDWLIFSGMLTFRALATAVTRAVALPKRPAGSLLRLRTMTAARAGRICGLMSAGGVGLLCICCIKMSLAVSP